SAAPDDARLHYRIAAGYIETGKHAEALTELERCIALEPGFVDAYVRLGNVYQAMGDVARAEQRYREALALDREALLAHYNLALVLRGQVRAREALDHFRSAHAVMPLRGEMLRSYALALVDCEEYAEADRVCAEATREEP